MLFIGDTKTKRFKTMIVPLNIIRDNDYDIIVEDMRGIFHRLHFDEMKNLTNMLSTLRQEGRATAICHHEELTIEEFRGEHDREIEYNEIDDIDFEIER